MTHEQALCIFLSITLTLLYAKNKDCHGLGIPARFITDMGMTLTYLQEGTD